MLCPFHLEDVSFKFEKVAGSAAPIYKCPDCGEQIPALYVQQYDDYPPVIVNAIGFRQHGKTVAFASLFYLLKKLKIAHHWPGFFTMGLNEHSLDTVHDNANMLKTGELPDSTPKNFPIPTMLRVEGVPFQDNCTLLCYDTGGECFEKPTQMIRYASFVKHANTALFLISISDLEDPGEEMHKLLNTYVVGMGELEATTADQHLVVVFTKADEIIDLFNSEWEYLSKYLLDGSVDGLSYPEGYMKQLRIVSSQLSEFLRNKIGANEFVSAAESNFKSVEFSIVSALGAEPQGGHLVAEIVPRRVLDPLLWMMEKSKRPKRWWLF